jgi:hypothetical protein
MFESDLHLGSDESATTIVIGAVEISKALQVAPNLARNEEVEDDFVHANIIAPASAPNVRCIVFQTDTYQAKDALTSKELSSFYYVGNYLLWWKASTFEIKYI